MKKVLLLTAVFMFVTGCATGYHERGLSGGYSETALSPRIYSVSFKGNGYTGSDRAAELALLRAAEITIDKGFTHFTVIDKASASSIASLNSHANSSFSSTAYGTSYGSAQTRTTAVRKPSSNMTVYLMGAEAPEWAYDANFLIRSLSGKYKVKRLQEEN